MRNVRWAKSSVMADDGHRIPLRIYETETAVRKTLVWAHGGSWIRGSLNDWHAACLSVAALCGMRVVSVGYRLAPEWTHPTALHDLLAALDWASSLLDDPGTQLFVGGDSAGGTLAASASLWCRDHGKPLAGQVLAYPPLDPDCRAPSYFKLRPGFPDRVQLQQSWALYRGAAKLPDEERYLTPLNVADLSGVCATAILTGSLDPVADDVRIYAGELRRAGVHATLRIDPTVGHGDFLALSGMRPNPVHAWIASTLKTGFDSTKDTENRRHQNE
ncbi:acetyl esterase [Cryobacterium luteum]|nr:acetyl esterase [Cryobacterium luteum]